MQTRSLRRSPQHGAYGDLSSAARKTFINVMRGGKLPAGRSSRVVRRSDGPQYPYHCANQGEGGVIRRESWRIVSSCTAVVSLAVVLISSVTAVAHTHAQTAPHSRRRRFAQSSTRRAADRGLVRGDRFFAPIMTVRDLIRVANLVEEIQISGGPAWIESERFAIEASTGPGVSPDDARAMIRAMLADRFKLKTHTEKHDLQGFSLIAVRGNTNDRRPSGAECAPLRSPAGIPAPPPPPPPPPGGRVLPLTQGTALSKCGAALGPSWLSLAPSASSSSRRCCRERFADRSSIKRFSPVRTISISSSSRSPRRRYPFRCPRTHRRFSRPCKSSSASSWIRSVCRRM